MGSPEKRERKEGGKGPGRKGSPVLSVGPIFHNDKSENILDGKASSPTAGVSCPMIGRWRIGYSEWVGGSVFAEFGGFGRALRTYSSIPTGRQQGLIPLLHNSVALIAVDFTPPSLNEECHHSNRQIETLIRISGNRTEVVAKGT